MPQQRKVKRRPEPAAPPRKERPVPLRLQGISGVDDGRHPAWRLSLLDLEYAGSWSWTVAERTLRGIVDLLTQMERLTWVQIRNQMTGGRRRGPLHKDIPVEHLCDEAQQRLQDLQLDDFDHLFRFRRGNFPRLWGVVHDDVFYALWWDEQHRVCPSRDQD